MPLGTRSQGYGYEPQAQAGCGQMRCEPCTCTPTGTWTVPASCVLCAGRWVSAAWVAKLGCWCCLVFRVHAEPAVFTLGVYSKYVAEISVASFHHNLASDFRPEMLPVGRCRLVLALASLLGPGSGTCLALCCPRCSRSLLGSGRKSPRTVKPLPGPCCVGAHGSLACSVSCLGTVLGS